MPKRTFPQIPNQVHLIGLLATLAGALLLAPSLNGCTHLKYGFASNPLEDSPEIRTAGKALYDTNCASCHGFRGEGDGPEAANLPAPATNLPLAQREWSDGVFQIRMISPPENGMPSFRDTLTEEERWQIIRYVRSLDTGSDVTPEPASP